MPEIKRYHRMVEYSHVGCERPCAYFIPFAKGEDASADREKSSLLTSLCGEWDFRFFENIERLEIEKADFACNVRCEDKMAVPGCWQLNVDKGYDVPNYINQDYPYPVDPPHLPDVIPCGFYRKKIDFTKKENRKYYINFEGVSSCFYLWVNGSFAAYSQVSHSTSVIDITDYLVSGENTFEVLVVKHCDGSYLEDQDFFRLSGIFREVYILEREEKHIKDIRLINKVNENLDSAALTVELESADAQITLKNSKGETVASGNTEDGKIKFEIENPELWNYEVPVLYSMEIETPAESICLSVGFKRFEIKNSCVYLNGKKVKSKGINRHDSNPETGYWVSVEQMLEELYMFKRANVNTIRTSHYPNDPRFLEMCDRLGFMVIDEADIETHGMGYNFGDWYWDFWSHLSDIPEWREVYIDRAKLLYERDKNHVCVIMWSLGNESGCGENHRAMANFIRSRDEDAIIHYENARLEYEERVNKDFKDISDVESRMYASLEYLEEYLADDNLKKPFFYCEYVDSMSTGEIAAHWDGYEDNDKYFGGCVWEFCDHAVNIGTKENPRYRYGGDFGDWPNDGICCIDGLVYPDRSLRPGYFDMKKVYEPFEVKYDNGTINVRNKKFFTCLGDLCAYWEIEVDGKPVKSGNIDCLEIAPRENKDYSLFDGGDFDSLTTLNVYFRQRFDTEWAKAGYEVGFAQFILSDNYKKPESKPVNGLEINESFDKITVSCADTAYVFDKVTGVVEQITCGGKAMLDKPVSFNMWRTVTYNSGGYIETWKRARYDKIVQKTYNVSSENRDDSFVITADVAFSSAAMPPAVRARVEYVFTADGALAVKTNAKVTYNAPELPRFGLSIVLPESYDKTYYLGYGPMESYCERYGSARLSLYETTAKDDYEHYVAPQESSSHYAVRCAGVSDGKTGLDFYAEAPSAFCFKAIPYSDTDIHNTAHDDELPESRNTFVSLDYKIHAGVIGREGKYPERIFNEKEFEFCVRIEPHS